MSDIYSFLQEHGITYERFDHPAVFTCEESEKLCPDMPGNPTKNLFLRDKNGGRHFLVSVGHDKSADLKKLKDLLGVSKLSFASPERLKQFLGVEPGSVTLFGLMNDKDHKVEVIIDKNLWDGQLLQCHPLVNTATLAIPQAEMKKFLELTRHAFQILEVPGREL
ncbi:MAG: prolyl-tRNA synthetase associated domain-containing protein [Patescibacteria group bacterium]